MPPVSLWPLVIGAGLCTVVFFPLFVAIAMLTLPAAHGGIVLGIMPLATAAAAALLAHERPSPGFWLAGAVGSLIVLVFVYRQSGGFGFSSGDIFLLATVVAGALGYTFSGRLSMLLPGWEVISWQVALFLPLAVIALLLFWPAQIAAAPLSATAGLAYVGLVSQYLAFFVFNKAMAMGGVARISQMLLLQPFVIVTLAYPINGERIRLETILFAGAVVLVVLIGQRARVRRK